MVRVNPRSFISEAEKAPNCLFTFVNYGGCFRATEGERRIKGNSFPCLVLIRGGFFCFVTSVFH